MQVGEYLEKFKEVHENREAVVKSLLEKRAEVIAAHATSLAEIDQTLATLGYKRAGRPKKAK